MIDKVTWKDDPYRYEVLHEEIKRELNRQYDWQKMKTWKKILIQPPSPDLENTKELKKIFFYQ